MKKFLFIVLAMMIFAATCNGKPSDLNFRELEEKYDAQIGVYVFDTNDGGEIAYNADKRFAYCSTHKFLSVGALLQKKNLNELDTLKIFSTGEIVPYSPITQEHVDSGLTLAEICEASLRVSDNTAANLVLEELGGVEAFKASLRAIGDEVTEPARLEPELNIFAPDDISDTSTPRQLAKDLELYLLGDLLSDDKKILLATWLSGNAITDELIKAGVPKSWKVFDKSGTGNYGTRNDVAIVCPPTGKPIVVAIMTRRNEADAKFERNLIAEVTRMIFNSRQ